MIITGERLRPWVEGQLSAVQPPGTQFLGRIVDGQPVVVVGFHSWTGDDVELNLAALPGSGSRLFLKCVWQYVFGQLGCARCTAFVRADNTKSQKLVRRLGFVPEGVKRKAQNGHSLLMYGLLREDLNGKFT